MQGQRIGYVRVSTVEQNPERQLDGVTVDRLFTEKASGKDTQRPRLNELLAFARDLGVSRETIYQYLRISAITDQNEVEPGTAALILSAPS